MRYITPTDGIWAWMREHKPLMSFNARNASECKVWQRRFRSLIRKLLGPVPPRVPLNPEITEEIDMGDYTRKRVIFDADAYATVPAYLLVPKGIKRGEKRPAILAAHGHGWGKIDVCGIGDGEDRKSFIAALNYDYAQQFVRRGYVVIAPDWRGFGERASNGDWSRAGRDSCNVNYLAYGYQGYHLIALQINDGKRAVDYLQTLPEVDPKRIGCVGLSYGGTMTTYLSAFEPRIRVACISGYLSSLEDAISMRGLGNFCGAQFMPGLAKYGDISDVASLIAPKPLVVEMGEQDTCFVIDDMKEAYERVRSAYKVRGYPERIASDIHPGEHMFSGLVAFDWFEKWL
ncbi:MAG: alpha/beta fold hydrolase [Armatimonadota bacterium]|nr:alpha/beta fold hydrolase [Armatimonadota bacterium]